MLTAHTHVNYGRVILGRLRPPASWHGQLERTAAVSRAIALVYDASLDLSGDGWIRAIGALREMVGAIERQMAGQTSSHCWFGDFSYENGRLGIMRDDRDGEAIFARADICRKPTKPTSAATIRYQTPRSAQSPCAV